MHFCVFMSVFAVSVVCNYSCGISRKLVVIAQMEGFIYISGLKKVSSTQWIKCTKKLTYLQMQSLSG